MPDLRPNVAVQCAGHQLYILNTWEKYLRRIILSVKRKKEKGRRLHMPNIRQDIFQKLSLEKEIYLLLKPFTKPSPVTE